jgi:hypothetical protein
MNKNPKLQQKKLNAKGSIVHYPLQGEHLVAEFFTEPPRKMYPFIVYSGGC